MNRISLLPLTPSRCRGLRATYPSPVLVRVGGYGPAAVADLNSAALGTRSAAIFVNVHNLGWRFVNAIGTGRPVVGTAAIQDAAGAAMLARVLPALKTGSCTAVARDFLADSIKVKPEPGVRTPSAANCFNRESSRLKHLLREGTDAITRLGGNARVTFYRVAAGTNDRFHFVFIVLNQNHKPVLFSDYPLSVPRGFTFAAALKAAAKRKEHGSGKSR